MSNVEIPKELMLQLAKMLVFPECVRQSFAVASQNEKPEPIGQILERAAYWAEWAVEKLDNPRPR